METQNLKPNLQNLGRDKWGVMSAGAIIRPTASTASLPTTSQNLNLKTQHSNLKTQNLFPAPMHPHLDALFTCQKAQDHAYE